MESANQPKAERRQPPAMDKERYEAPKVLASYDKDELETALQVEVHGSSCGCGSVL